MIVWAQITLVRRDGDGLVVAVADLLLALLGNAEQIPDRPHRHEGAEIGDEVEAVGVAQGIQCADTEFAHQVLDGQHPPRGEDA